MMLDATMKGRSCYFAAVFAAIVCMALPSFAADRTISSNYTLTADETVDGILTVESGVTVDLDGHNLTVQGLAGAGTITCNASILSELRMAIPQNAVSANSTVTISGNIRLVKEGLGKFVMEKVGQTYTGGTSLADGTLALGGTASLDWTQLTFGTAPAKPVTLEVGPTATIANIPNPWKVQSINGVDTVFCKQGGDWSLGSGALYLGGTSGATASFQHNGGILIVGGYLSVGEGGTGLLDICGGTVESTHSGGPYTLIGNTKAATVVVTNSGSLVVSGPVAVGNNSGSSGTLVVADGGTVSVGGSLIFCNRNASTSGRVDLGRGGVISAVNASRNKAGSATFNFDGGTFKKASGTGNIFAASGINVTLSANGGTIDNNGLAITIPCTITGAGGLTLSGTGTTTISANQSYTGTTTVSKGTTLAVSGVTLAGPLSLEAGSKLNLVNYSGVSLIAASALALPESGTVALTLNGDAFPAGEYVICSAFGGVTASDGDKFVPSTGGKAASWSIVDNKLILTVSTVSSAQDFTWAGGAAANWSDANVWMNADAAATWADNNNAIFNTANAMVTLNNDVTAAGVVFSADATISTNGTDAATLTVPTVSVAQNVSATIAAPTVGALEKTGAGTLTLTESRTDATTVTAGTLKMDGATVSTLTLGTNGGAPVVFDYGGQPKAGNVNSYLVKGSCVTLTNGTFTMSNLNDGTALPSVLPSVLTIAKDATLLSTSGTALFDAVGEATVNIAGGTWRKSSNNKTTIQDYSANGRLNINVTDGGTFASQWDVYCMVYEGTEVTETPSLYMKLVESTLAARNFYFPNVSQPTEKLPLRPTGVLAATNSTITVATTFAIGRNTQDAKTAGSFTADFERCTITAKTFAVYHDRPLNNARFNDTRFVFNAASGSIAASDGEANWITVGDNGLTLDTQAYACSLNANLGGSGAVTKIGTGMLTVTSNQTSTAAFDVNEGTNAVNGGVSISRPMTIASGATLKVNATDTVSISSLTPAAGSTLDIASYNGKTPLALTLLTLPAEGRVNLTLNGGAFTKGVYAIYSKSGVMAAEGDKFTFTTTDELVDNWKWSVDDDTLILTVGEISGNFWTGRGGDGKMSTGANWGSGEVPAAGSDIDLSGITAATTIIAAANRKFGAVTMGTGVITFTGSLSATSFVSESLPGNPTKNVAVGANSSVTIDGDLVFAGTGDEYICNTVAAGGRFVVTGDIVATPDKGVYLRPSVTTSIAGVIAAKGLVNNSGKVNCFVLAPASGQVNWEVGENGISGDSDFMVSNYRSETATATIIAATNFTIAATITNNRLLVLNTSNTAKEPCTITIGNGLAGLISGVGGVQTLGSGKVLFNSVSTFGNELGLYGTSTVAVNSGCRPGNGVVHANTGTAFEIAKSGTVTLNGNLTLDSETTLAFNFTERTNPPVLALASGKSVVFTEGASTNIVVKVSGDVWPTAGEKELTACGGFDVEGVTVTLPDGAPDWVKSVYVNDAGNIAIDVKPIGTRIILR